MRFSQIVLVLVCSYSEKSYNLLSRSPGRLTLVKAITAGEIVSLLFNPQHANKLVCSPSIRWIFALTPIRMLSRQCTVGRG